MWNILHLTETSEPGGSETVLACIARNLDSTRYRSVVCLLSEGWLSDHLRNSGVRYVIIENKRSFDPVFLVKLVHLMKREKIHLVHSHEFMMNVYGAVAARIAQVPMIGTVHSMLYFTEKTRRILAYKLSTRLCSRLVAVSDNLKKLLTDELKVGNPSKILTIYNGIDLNRYVIGYPNLRLRDQMGISAGTLVAGTVGSLFKVKGIPYLLDAVSKVVTCFPNFKLLIIGEGDQESTLRHEVVSMGLEETVEFLGFRNDIPELLNLLDVYICASVSEGLSLSILEAMAAGKPVIATEVGGNPELVIPGKNGFLVPPRNPDALAERIMVALKDKNLRQSMGQMGRRIVEERFSLERMIDNYQILYERLLGRKTC